MMLGELHKHSASTVVLGVFKPLNTPPLQAVVEASRSSLTYICTVVNCVAVNWSWRLRALALLAAMSLEPSDELMDLIDALYDTTEELHDCHLVESPESVQVRNKKHTESAAENSVVII